MIHFEEVWKYTDQIPGSFTELNGRKLYEYALQYDGQFVEVGVDQGRSASVLLFAARQTGARITLIDSWESVLIDNMEKVIKRFRADFPDESWSVVNKRSAEAARELFVANTWETRIDFVHIDANHYDDNPATDCQSWLPKLRQGGIACFHDVGSTFPAVDEAVAKYTAGWKDLGVWDSLAIRRKP